MVLGGATGVGMVLGGATGVGMVLGGGAGAWVVGMVLGGATGVGMVLGGATGVGMVLGGATGVGVILGGGVGAWAVGVCFEGAWAEADAARQTLKVAAPVKLFQFIDVLLRVSSRTKPTGRNRHAGRDPHSLKYTGSSSACFGNSASS
jgi:hypothetical protein